MKIVYYVLDFFSKIDKNVSEFQMLTGLRCPSACGGICCLASDVQTTVLEMLPAAHEILCRGETAQWLERIAAAQNNCCVFYQAKCLDDNSGHCLFYNRRPSVCRLFGFATVRNRDGENLLSVCKHLKKNSPDIVREATAQKNAAPCLSDIGSQVFAIEPMLGLHLMPINMALAKAIERIGLHMQLSHGETLSDKSVA